jgi:hypothetical protein
VRNLRGRGAKSAPFAHPSKLSPSLTRVTSFFPCRKKAAHDKKSRDAPGRRLARASKAYLLAIRNLEAIAVVYDRPCLPIPAATSRHPQFGLLGAFLPRPGERTQRGPSQKRHPLDQIEKRAQHVLLHRDLP